MDPQTTLPGQTSEKLTLICFVFFNNNKKGQNELSQNARNSWVTALINNEN